ncbi:Ada metal-binding domain-containing protein [Fluviicola sp.]|uniref:Ada metal-binding domain-containing protein n=1 Tax=Fluviicola sp. TaxID=1917219 RepID=UPI002616716C|nr:Ada metal-binding domain-containing protein [Fluviicola sp.]
MLVHAEISDQELRSQIRRKMIGWGGNKKLKIYGKLHCASGRRMKRENRVFFESEEEALRKGYRPCGNCLRESYQKWKHEAV